MEEVLTDWISRGAASDAMASLTAGVENPLYTPAVRE
jgi:hypothetical protein